MARITEETMAGQIRSLSVGQVFSRSARLDLTDTDRVPTTDALRKLRNLVNQAVGRVRKENPGSSFRVESVVGLTDDKQVHIATVAVTCFDSANANDDEDIDDI